METDTFGFSAFDFFIANNNTDGSFEALQV